MTFTRRQFLGSSAIALAGSSILRSPLFGAQQGPATKFIDLRDDVGIFTGSGGTIGWFANNDGAIAVDSQFPNTAAACVSGLKDRSPRGISMLINTHHHGDHVGGNSVFRPAVTRIVQQEKCAKYHRDTTTANAAQQAYADLTFGGSWSTTIGREKVWAEFNGAGHTGGDAIVIFEKANVVHMGDLMFNRMHPFIDRPNGASIQSWTKVLAKVADKHKDALFVFGHAKAGLPLTGSAADLRFFRDYLSAVLDTAQQGIKAGKSLAEITTQPALPGFEDFASSPPRLTLAAALGVAFEELGGKKEQ
jgi:glyoxylase-like metal-dependent hydrolase (beta-lactamase superfamily II)